MPDQSRFIPVTYDGMTAQEIIDTLHLSTCAACGQQITAETLGTVLTQENGYAAFHNSPPCSQEFIEWQNEGE